MQNDKFLPVSTTIQSSPPEKGRYSFQKVKNERGERRTKSN
jgi:hypothetical protein